MPFFLFNQEGDTAVRITPRYADSACNDTDPGANLDEFVVIAATQYKALGGARRWVACWQNETETCVPDDLFLTERTYRPGKIYMVLTCG